MRLSQRSTSYWFVYSAVQYVFALRLLGTVNTETKFGIKWTSTIMYTRHKNNALGMTDFQNVTAGDRHFVPVTKFYYERYYLF